MGVKRLWKVLRLFRRQYSFLIPRHRPVLVDAFNVIYAYAYNYTNENFHVAAVYRVAVKLMKHGLVPVFVFDNASSLLKKQTYLNRYLARVHLFDESDVDLTQNDQAQFYQFAESEKAEPTFRDQILYMETQLSQIIFPRAQAAASASSGCVELQSYAYYCKSRKLSLPGEAEAQFELLYQELYQFSDSQVDRLVNYHKNRATVDFDTQRQRIQFSGDYNDDKQYNVIAQFASVLDAKEEHFEQVEPIRVVSADYKATDLGEDVQGILQELNIPVNRTEIERSLLLFNYSMRSTFRQNKISLQESFNFYPHLNARKIQQCKDLLNIMYLPHFTAAANTEAEQLAASFTRERISDFVFSRDGDSMVFGASNLLLFEEETLWRISAADLEACNLTRHALIYISMLLGGDFHVGAIGIGEVGALEFLAAFGPVHEQPQLVKALDATEHFFLSGEIEKTPLFARLQSTRSRMMQQRDPKYIVEQFYNRDALKLYLNQESLEKQVLSGYSSERYGESLLAVNKKYLQFCAGHCDSSLNLYQFLTQFHVQVEDGLSDAVRHVLAQEAKNQQNIQYQLLERQTTDPETKGAGERVHTAMGIIRAWRR